MTQEGINHDVGSQVAGRGTQCLPCLLNQGIHRKARYSAAQSGDNGRTVSYVPICEAHADGWNDGGDWNAPVIPL